MGGRFRFGWVIGLVAVAMLAAVGVYTYNLGVAQGLAESGRLVAAPGTTVPVVFWPRPWFGFGFFPFFPLFILLWIFVIRGLFWRNRWYGRGYGYACGGVPPAFDEWHRRAHGGDVGNAAQGAPPPSADAKA